MLDAVLATDPVEQHLHRGMEEPAGEHLGVISQDLLGHPVGGQRGAQPIADCPGTFGSVCRRRSAPLDTRSDSEQIQLQPLIDVESIVVRADGRRAVARVVRGNDDGSCARGLG